jgi:lipid-A-disaccharide synthase
MKFYIIAGERSGDLHGGNLVKEIIKRDPDSVFQGFGGEHMQRNGVKLTVHYSDLAFMGLAEVVTNMNKIRRYIRQCKDDIIQYRPDVVVLIDYGGFNLQIARFCKKMGIKVYFYIPPKYWAWYQNRALWLKPYVDKLFVILPFEKEFFKKFQWEADYVGNPVLDAVKAHQPDLNFLTANHFSKEKPLIALLPGSRKQELKTIIPLMTQVVKKFPEFQFGLAAVSNLSQELYGELPSFANVKFVLEDTYNLLQQSSAAIVTSGTATLETALFRVPQVVVYKASPISFWLAKFLISVPFISLVNLIAGREVVKEMIQKNANEEKVSDELKRMINDTAYRQTMLNGYNEIIKTLDTGSASENTAALMLKYLKKV